MAWDFSTEPEFEAKLEWMRGFVREEIYPIETLDLGYDEVLGLIRPLQAEVKEQGLWAAHLPPELGGMGFGQVKLGLMHEILGQTPYAPVVFGNNAPDSGNAELLAYGIEATGREDQRAEWLQPLLDGKLRSAFSMTEPNTAGSDPTRLSTQAVRDGDEYIINGHKWFTSNGSVADFLIVMAVTNPDIHPYQGSSMFIVPVDTPGVDIVRDVATMEDPTSHFGKFGNHAEIYYRDVRIPAANLVGNEGDGFKLAQQRLGPGRIHHCMRWLGQSRRAFDMLCERSVSRYAHGSLLAEKQTVQNWVSDSLAEMHAARLMTLHAAWKMDQDGASAARLEIAMIKYYGAGVLYNVIDRAIQVHGALGYSCDLPLESMYRAARAARIYDGPDEVHRQTVARRTLKNYEPREVPSEHVPTRREAAKAKFAELLDRATANDCELAVAIATATSADDPDQPALLGALAELAITARPVAWDDPAARWDEVDLVVVRSTWDYVARRDAFCAWADRVPRLANPAPVLRWNTDKSYLAELAARGVPVVETSWVAPGESPVFPAVEFVVKPSVSVGGRDSARFGTDQLDEAVALVAAIHASGRSAMVQPYVASVATTGEHGLIYIGGAYSHAIAKGPLLARADPSKNVAPEDQPVRAYEADQSERELAAAALAAVPGGSPLLYARVDMVLGADGCPRILELELTEPFLFMSLAPGAPMRLASAIADRLA